MYAGKHRDPNSVSSGGLLLFAVVLVGMFITYKKADVSAGMLTVIVVVSASLSVLMYFLVMKAMREG